MRLFAVVAVAGLLLGATLAGAAVLVLRPTTAEGPEPVAATAVDERAPADHAMHGSHGGAARHEPATRFEWPPENGQVPSKDEAESSLKKVRYAFIEDDSGFTPENGVTGGSGTPEDPFVFDGVYVVRDLYVADTTSYFIVRNSYVGGQLTLNWVGDRAYVHHNYVRDLRVNENVRRTGDATGGLFEENLFGVVGQIRHFDGVFRSNTVGPDPGGDIEKFEFEIEWPFSDRTALNIDGFLGAEFYDNDVSGFTSIRLHGHHHASSWDAGSHNHGEGVVEEGVDHTERYHWIDFHDNRITVESGTALVYTDNNHAANDRTARSEDNPALEGPHVHYTRVVLRDNVLDGGGLRVATFNDDDRYHKERNPGELVIRGNDITVTAPADTDQLRLFFEWRILDGVHADTSKEMTLLVEGNRIRFEGSYEKPAEDGDLVGGLTSWLKDEPPAGVRFSGFRDSELVVRGNEISGTYYGVKAEWFEPDVSWRVVDNTFTEVVEEIYWDDSVESGAPGADGV